MKDSSNGYQVFPVRLLQRLRVLVVGDPLQDELLVARLAKAQTVPVGLLTRQDPGVNVAITPFFAFYLTI
jgi:hypothetical protein